MGRSFVGLCTEMIMKDLKLTRLMTNDTGNTLKDSLLFEVHVFSSAILLIMTKKVSLKPLPVQKKRKETIILNTNERCNGSENQRVMDSR